MGAVKTLLTWEDFEKLPSKPGKQELVNGELIELPPADDEHGEISERLFLLFREILASLNARGEARDLGLAHHERGYKLGPQSWLIPDVSITRAEQRRVGKYLDGAPALAVEVLSESNTVSEITAKIFELFAKGCREVWVIDRDRRSIGIYKPDWTTQSLTGRFTSDLLPGFEIDLEEILGQ